MYSSINFLLTYGENRNRGWVKTGTLHNTSLIICTHQKKENPEFPDRNIRVCVCVSERKKLQFVRKKTTRKRRNNYFEHDGKIRCIYNNMTVGKKIVTGGATGRPQKKQEHVHSCLPIYLPPYKRGRGDELNSNKDTYLPETISLLYNL